MVVEALASMSTWRSLTEDNRQLLFAAALLHDVAKPSCTREENGRIISRGHSLRGSIDARQILWEFGTSFVVREQICSLIRHHQAPFHLIDHDDSVRRVLLISQTARCDLLGILAQADITGRICGDLQEVLEKIALFEELCQEHHCFNQPRAFPSTHSRFEYFRSENRNPDYAAHEELRCIVTMMSGLPGAGKDTWITRHAPGTPVISLDAIREELQEEPTGSQGRVVLAAREQARVFLRKGQDFVWNATNLSREIRGQLIDLFTSYHARIRIVYVETSAENLFRQNKTRAEAVPASAIERMMHRWEVPSQIEAQRVEWWIDGECSQDG
jgi:predicted kinase